MSIADDLAQSLRIYRKMSGLTQEQLAEKCELDRTSISSAECAKGNLTIKNLEKIAEVLGIPPVYMLMKPSLEGGQGENAADGATPYDLDSLGKYEFAVCRFDDEGVLFRPVNSSDSNNLYIVLATLARMGYMDEFIEGDGEIAYELISLIEKLEKLREDR